MSEWDELYREAILDHYRNPRQHGTLEHPDISYEDANPLCGDRIRVQVRVIGDTIHDARFTADACAICIAAASVLTAHVRGMPVNDAARVEPRWIHTALEGEPPAGRAKCATLPLDTLRRALAASGGVAP